MCPFRFMDSSFSASFRVTRSVGLENVLRTRPGRSGGTEQIFPISEVCEGRSLKRFRTKEAQTVAQTSCLFDLKESEVLSLIITGNES